MTTMTDDILQMLENDMVSHGNLAQYLKQSNIDTTLTEKALEDALMQILESGKIAIGIPIPTSPEYVEFVAWNGPVRTQVERAIKSVDSVSGHDKEFAYWLCLQENVDRFEGSD